MKPGWSIVLSLVTLLAFVPIARADEAPGHPRFLSIAETAATGDAFIVDRCESFRIAIAAYRQIMRSNPLYGRNPSQGAEFNWIDDPRFLQPLQIALTARTDRTVNHIAEYMDAFGSVSVPSTVPSMSLYQSDKATCLRHFKTEDMK